MKLTLLWVLLLSSALAAEYPAQKINRVDSVHFGQPQPDVEHLLGVKASSDDSGIGRPDKDFVLEDRGIKLDFDTGRLDGITFDSDFSFIVPIAPFIENWRNLDPIGVLRIKRGMKKAEFLEYFAAWEARAKQLGIRRYDGNELLKEGEYSVSVTQDELMDMIHISFGPERSTWKGGSWGSACSVSFVTPQLAPMYGRKAGTLDSISMFCDEFNTHARHPQAANQPAQPTPPKGS